MNNNTITALEQVFSCIENNQNFVLQGGAGSGKTELLTKVLERISSDYPGKKIACITHTNVAVSEIISRVGEGHTILTIHSFLNSLIKNYKKNIHEVIPEIFKLKYVRSEKDKEVDLKQCEYDPKAEKKIRLEQYEEYKKAYGKYAQALYRRNKQSVPKVVGKPEYDKATGYNHSLNSKIKLLNIDIETIVSNYDYNLIKYNETRFDNFEDLSFGHDSLLIISCLLFERYPTLCNIVQDKFDFIFIDEYQDTNKDIIDAFMGICDSAKTRLGLFGDSMQGIYKDGIKDAQNYINKRLIQKIEKKDNYRSSKQVIDFINQFRDDGLKQEVAFKINNGVQETIEDRQGEVKLYYSIYDGTRTESGLPKDKEKYREYLNRTITKVREKHQSFKNLMLTNKSIASELGFENLYGIFDARYIEVKEEMEEDLKRLNFKDLAELSMAYNKKNYNFVITEIKKAGFTINSVDDKEKISKILNEINISEQSAFEVLNQALKDKLIKESDSYKYYIHQKDIFLKDLNANDAYKYFKNQYENGQTTFLKIVAYIKDLAEEKFNEYLRFYKKERFYNDLFSDKVKFKEIINYFSYLNGETDYITMHKTKGSGIENVMVILEEYFWYSEYKFNTIFESSVEDLEKKLKNQKLFYVASSRAIKNLICVKIIAPSEENDILKYFENHEKIELN